MIPRHIEKRISPLMRGYPAITITGPRQSGKTTLAKRIFGKKPYLSFENPDTLEEAAVDPRSFLERYSTGAVFDEVQRFPKLLSYLQQVIDEVNITEPVIDFISNIDGEITRDPAKIKENLINQLDNRTLWEASVRNAAGLGISEFLEVGPGSVLKGLIKKIDPKLNVATLHTSEDIDTFVTNLVQA